MSETKGRTITGSTMVDRNLLVRGGKVFTLVVGIAVLGLGLHSHFESKWVKNINVRSGSDGYVYKLKPYRLCGVKGIFQSLRDSKCPSISMEHYFVGVVIVTFFVSFGGLVAEFFKNLKDGHLKLADLCYHGVAALLLFSAGVLYIISAVQISNLQWGNIFDDKGDPLNFRKSEKIWAGTVTIFQSLLYGAVAVLIKLR